MQESGISPPRGQTARGVRDPSTKHERSLDKPFTMADRQNRSFTRLSIISRSCPAPFPDWGRGFRDHHRWVPSEARLIHKNRPNQVLSLSRKGKGIWSNPWDFTSSDLRWQRKLARGPGSGERTAVTGSWGLCASVSALNIANSVSIARLPLRSRSMVRGADLL